MPSHAVSDDQTEGKRYAIRHAARSLTPTFLILSYLGSWLIAAPMATAQVIPDGSLSTTVNPSGNNFTIENGDRAGNNLFHSFREFSIPTNGSAFFNNAADIQNIFSRVTGGNFSNIDGLIRANGGANLFLLNPAGIVFGPNARLDIGGSFFGSTANSIQFVDGVEFSAINPTATPLLTVSVPVGLQFGQNPSSITVQGPGHRITVGQFSPFDLSNNPIGLQVKAGSTLALIGGDIAATGGILTAPGGQIALGSIGQSNATPVVGLQPASQGWNLNYNAIQQFGDIALDRATLLDASSNGSIELQGRNISLQNGSLALIQNLSATPPGDIQVNASGLLSIVGVSVSPTGLVRSSLETQTVAAKGGDIQNNVILTEHLGRDRGGNLNISVGQLQIQAGGTIAAVTYASGVGGNISVNATNSIQLLGTSPLNPTINSSISANSNIGGGWAGNVVVTTPQLLVTNGGGIYNTNVGGRGGGNLTVNSDSIHLMGENRITTSGSALTTASFFGGDSGNLIVNTRQLILEQGGFISASTLGDGDAGNLTVNATESIEVRGRGLGSPSRISAAGALLPLPFQRAFRLPAQPTGNSGNAIVNTPVLQVSDGAKVSVAHAGTGDAGFLQINADRISLDRGGEISASTLSGEGGNITLNVRESLQLRHGSLIDTESRGTGNGGNITIDSPTIVGLENSDIIANAVRGNGGNIQINTQGIFGLQNRPQLTPGSDITASSQFGLSGNVTITNPEVETKSFLVELPQNLVDTSGQITTGCDPTQGNTFTVAGRGGLPEDPTSGLLGRAIWFDDRDLSADGNTAALPERKLAQPQPTQMIQEATGWVINAQGQVELVANSPRKTSSWELPASCQTLPLSSHKRSHRVPSGISQRNVF